MVHIWDHYGPFYCYCSISHIIWVRMLKFGLSVENGDVLEPSPHEPKRSIFGSITDHLTVTPLQVTSFELGCSNLVCQLKMVTYWSLVHMNPSGPYLGPLRTILLLLLYKSHRLSSDAQIWFVSWKWGLLGAYFAWTQTVHIWDHYGPSYCYSSTSHIVWARMLKFGLSVENDDFLEPISHEPKWSIFGTIMDHLIVTAL